jgi:ethylbenzene dioxygenase subunit beta
MSALFAISRISVDEILGGTGIPGEQDLVNEVTHWLILEAQLLDDRREREWLEQMVSENIVYQVPVRQSVERARGMGFSRETFHLDERYGSLRSKVARNETGFAWAEDPPSRIRHFITNIRSGREEAGVIKVHSNVLVYRTRQDQTTPQILSAERQDLLRRENGRLRLLRRLVLLDMTAIASHNLAFFF